MKILEKKQKIKIEIPNLENLNYDTVEVKEIIMSDNDNLIVLYIHDNNLICENGLLVFPNIKNVKDIENRYNGFRFKSTFWGVVNKKITITSEDLINERKELLGIPTDKMKC